MDLNWRLIAVGKIARDPAWMIPRHGHAHHELIVPLSGRMTVNFDDEQISAGPGDVLFYRAGRHHTEASDPNDPVETRFVAFSSEAAAAWTWTRLVDRDGRVRELVSWLHGEWLSTGPAAAATRTAFSQAIHAECGRLMIQVEDPFLARVHAVMDHGLTRSLGIADLAAAAGLSRFHFIRTYRQATGRTPMAELRRRRVEAARHLVATTDLPLAAIPARVGVADVPHLTRLFRAVLGTTPGEIRRSLYRKPG